MLMNKPDKQFFGRDKINAKKSLGQNFCNDPRLAQEIAERLAATPAHQIWEIGPGKGALTRIICKSGAAMQLFEIDERMRKILENDFKKATVTWGDFLEIPDEKLPMVERPLLVCGNLPYYCGTPIIRRFLENGPKAERIVFLLQEEVSKKAASPCNCSDYGYLSVHTALFARASLGRTYPPSSFSPPPKINSTILVLEPLELSADQKQRRLKALKHVSFLFTQRRKMALPLLKKRDDTIDWSERFALLQIDEKARPENISPEQFLELFTPQS